MKRLATILIGTLVFLTSFMPYETMAQNTTKTAYQKRLEQIDKELAQKFGYSEPNDIVGLELMNGMAEYLKGRNTSRAKIYLWYINEQEAAKKLKTKVDFDREKREQEEAKFKKTDYYIIRERIKNNFEEWCQKGEFESSTTYEERLKDSSVYQFYKTCTDKITYYYEKIKIRGDLQQYNADNQYFPIIIYFDSGDYQKDRFFNITIPIPVEKAPYFKDKYRNDKWEKSDIGNLVFVDNYLVLKRIKYSGKKYDVQIGKYKAVEFAFKDLGIQNPYCADAVWNIDMIRIAEEKRIAEQRRLDSIACIKYNREIDSLILAYNQELLQNKYNFTKKIINAVRIQCGPGIETRYNTAKNNIIDNYNSIIAIAEAAKQKEQDSIACIDYNEQLDSIVESYNKKLLQEEYNFDKKTVKFLPLDLNSGKKGQEIKDWFNKEKKNINEKYNSIIADANNNKKIIEDYKQTNFNELKSFKFVNYNYHDMYNNCPGYLTRNIANPSAYNSKYSNALVEKLMEVTVDINTQLNNEWTKNGQYFENKVDFFNSFVKFWPYNVVSINPDYKTILKEKKKANK